MRKGITVFLTVMFLFVFAVTAFASLSDGLVAYYPFNGNANDESGNGNNGTVNGATLTTDRNGNANSAYSFNGTNAYILLNNTTTLNFTSAAFTLAALAKFDQTNTDNMLVAKHICGNVSGYFLGVGNYGGPSNVFDFFVNSDWRLHTTETYNDGKWHLVVGVYDGATQYLYVDGVLKVSQAKTYVNTNTTNITIGSATNCAYFNGAIDEARLYDRAISVSEIQELYSGTTTTCENATLSSSTLELKIPTLVVDGTTCLSVTLGIGANGFYPKTVTPKTCN